MRLIRLADYFFSSVFSIEGWSCKFVGGNGNGYYGEMITTGMLMASIGDQLQVSQSMEKWIKATPRRVIDRLSNCIGDESATVIRLCWLLLLLLLPQELQSWRAEETRSASDQLRQLSHCAPQIGWISATPQDKALARDTKESRNSWCDWKCLANRYLHQCIYFQCIKSLISLVLMKWLIFNNKNWK